MQGYYGGQQQPPQPPPGGGYAEYPHRPPTPPSPSDRSSSPPPQHREPGMWPCSRQHSALNLGENFVKLISRKNLGKSSQYQMLLFWMVATNKIFHEFFLHFLADFRELWSNTIITITNVIPAVIVSSWSYIRFYILTSFFFFLKILYTLLFCLIFLKITYTYVFCMTHVSSDTVCLI